MKKSILALAALLGTGAMGWAQNTTTSGTSGSTTTNTQQTNTSSTVNTPGTPTTPSTTENPSGVNGNAPTTNNMTGSPSSTGTPGTTSSMVNPGNSNTTGTLQSSTTAGVDYNTLQNTPNGNTQVTMQSNSNYAAYGSATTVPGNLSTSFQRDYPAAFNPSWQQAGDWYRASFNNQNRNMMVYYAPNGNSYTVALPVLNGYVPEEVVTKALSTYGNNLYSISRVKAANGQDAFQINTLDGGMARTEFIGEDGSSFAAIDVFRHDEGNMVNGELMNNSNNAANADSNSVNMNNNNNNVNNNTTTGDNTSGTGTNSSMSTELNTTGTSTETNTNMNSTEPKYKHKIKTDDGKKLKIKTKNGDTRVKGDAMDATGGQ